MQSRKFKLALSLATIVLAATSLTACQSNPFTQKAAEPAKAEAAAKPVAAAPAATAAKPAAKAAAAKPAAKPAAPAAK